MKKMIVVAMMVIATMAMSQSWVEAIIYKGLPQDPAEKLVAKILFPSEKENDLAPVISPTSFSGIWEEGEQAGFSFTVQDPEKGPVMTSIVGGPIGSMVAKVGTSTYEFKWQTNFSDAGKYNFSIKAMDLGGNSAMMAVMLTILNVDQGIVIEGYSPFMNTVTVYENSQTTFSIQAKSLEGKPLMYSWVYNGDHVDGNNTNACSLYFNYNSSGGPRILLVTTSDDSTASHQWKIICLNVNRPPTISPLSAIIDGKVNKPILIEVSGQDADNDSLIFSDGPVEGVLTITSPTTARWDWTPKVAGNYVVTFTVSDGHGGIATTATTLQISP